MIPKLTLYPDGSCEFSGRDLTIQFLKCTCSVGFKPSPPNSRCECDCDPALSSYVISCDETTNSILRANADLWITYINDTNSSGYVIYPVRPLDYCYPPNVNVSINFNLPSGSDA